MLLNEKKITLKNGSAAILRCPTAEDAEALLNCMMTASEETDNLLRYPEEWNITAEQEARWIKGSLSSPLSLTIVCIADGKLVGNCNISFGSGIKTKHRATVSIVILRDYWGLGIGTAMFSELIAAAREHGTEILELEYMEGNERGRRLYEKFGFRAVAERPNAFKLKDGTLLTEIMMQLSLQ